MEELIRTVLSLWNSKESFEFNLFELMKIKGTKEPIWTQLIWAYMKLKGVHKDSSKVNWFELMKLKLTQENSSELIWAYDTQRNASKLKRSAHRAREMKKLSKRDKEVTGFNPCSTFLGPIDSLIVFSVFPSWAIVKLRYKGYFDCSFLEDKGF